MMRGVIAFHRVSMSSQQAGWRGPGTVDLNNCPEACAPLHLCSVITRKGTLLRSATQNARHTHLPMTLLDMLVFAMLTRLSFARASTFTLSWASMKRTASLHASRYPLMTVVGWILFFTKSLARRRSSDATMTTEVVPSPTSLSCC